MTSGGPLSRTALRRLRLKPGPGQAPAERVYSRRRREHIDLFDPALCVPMREARPVTAAQAAALAAGRMRLTHAPCGGCLVAVDRADLSDGLCAACQALDLAAEAAARYRRRFDALRALLARGMSPRKTIFLDTETTGLVPGRDELLEVAAIDDSGVVFHSLVRPERINVWPDAELIHGIRPVDVQNAPSLAELLPKLERLLLTADAIVIYNAPFDLGFLPAGLRRLVEPVALCAMEAFALHAGDWDERSEGYRWRSLSVASSIAGHFWTSSQHRAVADAQAVQSVWNWLQQQVAKNTACA